MRGAARVLPVDEVEGRHYLVRPPLRGSGPAAHLTSALRQMSFTVRTQQSRQAPATDRARFARADADARGSAGDSRERE